MGNTDYATRALVNRQKRKQQVKYHIIALTVSLFLIVVISILLISFSTEANDMEHQPFYKYYKSIQVSKGDTLWSIANDNFDANYYKDTFDYIAEVKKLNALTSDDIVAGNYLIVPYYSPEFVSN